MLTRMLGSSVLVGALVVGSTGTAAVDLKKLPSFGVGSPGIGDPYFPWDGNGGYDVQDYTLDLTYDPVSDQLRGTATIRAIATQSLASFDLDLDDLRATRVTVEGVRATTFQAGGELVVVPRTRIREGRSFTTTVAYSGSPKTIMREDGYSGFIQFATGDLVAAHPHGATSWFPANDHPSDAATFTVTVKVPEGLQAISNGLPGEVATRNGWSQQTWTATDPLPTYLATLAVGGFDVSTYEVDGVTYVDAVDSDLQYLWPGEDTSGPNSQELARESLSRQPEIIAFLADRFGAYPLASAGAIVDNMPPLEFAHGASTRSVYPSSAFCCYEGPTDVVANQLARQWFGADLRLARWQDSWLSEGFAFFAEELWREKQGQGSAQGEFEWIGTFPADDTVWTVTLDDPGQDELFGRAVSLRGFMVLQALRNEVGEETFWDIVRTWTSRYSGQAVSTQQFTDLAQEVSGQDLAEFFTVWIETPAKPEALG